MATVRNKNSKAELSLRKALWRLGLRYRLHDSNLPGRPDITFAAAKVAVFVDGDFWHGRMLIEDGVEAFRATLRTSKRDWWVEKIRRNVQRDRRVDGLLADAGWRICRVWESDIKAAPEPIIRNLQDLVHSARAKRRRPRRPGGG